MGAAAPGAVPSPPLLKQEGPIPDFCPVCQGLKLSQTFSWVEHARIQREYVDNYTPERLYELKF